MTEKLYQEDSYPIIAICDEIGLARSSDYHQAAGSDDEQLEKAIKQVLTEFPT